jgi:hypothetical protein
VGSGISKEDHCAAISNHRRPPPRRLRQKPPSKPNELWPVLPADNREQILNALSRVVAEHLVLSPILREVTHEQP